MLAPLAVAIPLLAASLLSLAHVFLPRLASDVIAVVMAATSAVLCLVLLVHVGHGLDVYWFGGWRTKAGVAVGIDFAVGPIGAGLASFVSVLMVVALVYSSRYIGVEQPYYHVMMMIFMAGMVGFCLSGDIFNMFVMFELMSVAAVALVGYKIQEQAALEGGLNFAVINTIGAFLFLLGIGFLYGHTGALNLAQLGIALRHLGDSRVVVVAFALIACALLIKAAVLPFHFWLADAYSVALTPVCILLAGAMSELGIYGLGRIWFTAFEPALGSHAALLRGVFVAAGLLTALWGAVMAMSEDHLKRMLAFLTMSFVGVYLVAVGLLTEDGVAAAGLYVIADGFTKALLFACVGIVQHRLGHVGQARLHGRAAHLRGTALLFGAGGLLIGAIPPFGSFLGKSMLDDAAIKAGYGFVPPIIMLITALCGAAVLRAGGRIFLGWGEPPTQADPADEETRPESDRLRDRTPALMWLPAVALLLGALGTGVWFGFADLVQSGAHRFVAVAAYASTIYGHGVRLSSVTSSAPGWYDWLYCGGATILAVGLAGLELRGGRGAAPWRRIQSGASSLMSPIRRVHTGRVGDYTAALTLGVGVFGVLIALTLT